MRHGISHFGASGFRKYALERILHLVQTVDNLQNTRVKCPDLTIEIFDDNVHQRVQKVHFFSFQIAITLIFCRCKCKVEILVFYKFVLFC